jgi:hypothetical protein
MTAPRIIFKVAQLSQFSDKRAALGATEMKALAKELERQGDIALSQQLGLSRQTLARAVAGMRLYSKTLAVLGAYLSQRAA